MDSTPPVAELEIDPDKAEAGPGPVAYRNWIASQRPTATRMHGFEVLLFSDVPAVGGSWTFGPYELFNTLAGSANARGANAPPVALRIWEHLEQGEWHPSLEKPNVSGFHGGDLQDEVCVLISLLTGRRLRAGGSVREFRSAAEPGRPHADMGIPIPTVPPANLRRLPRQCALLELGAEAPSLLLLYPTMTPENAVALVRAARAYRDAIWIGEMQPELAWLLLVSAIECVANASVLVEAPTPLARLRRGAPGLVKTMENLSLSEDTQHAIAAETASLFKSTKKFLDFLSRFGPNEGPTPRPNYRGLPWNDRNAMSALFREIYRHRSLALHEALPIPPPMLSAPDTHSRGGLGEMPEGYASGERGGSWVHRDTMMLLHAFEYTVRSALLTWWAASTASS